MEVLTFNVDADRRGLVKDVQDFNVDFNDSKYNWIQARQYENQMRQAQVNVIHADGTPFDLTGANAVFEGILPDKTHRVIDARHGTIIDAASGQFRFDFPAPVFAVAGSYQQSFFRIYRNGQNIATLEFCLEVLADKVISGIVPSDYITPFTDLYGQLDTIVQNASGELKAALTAWQTKLQDLFDSLSKTGKDTADALMQVQAGLTTLEAQIKSDGLMTQADLAKALDGFTAQFAQLTADTQKALGDFQDGNVLTGFFNDETIEVGGPIPSYYLTRLNQFTTISADNFNVGFITDNHHQLSSYAPNSLAHYAYIAAASRRAPLQAIIAGGDNTNGWYTKTQKLTETCQATATLFNRVKAGTDVFFEMGNHDNGIGQNGNDTPDTTLSDAELKAFYQTHSLVYGENRDNGSLYGFKDYPDKKVRLIWLNSFDLPYTLNVDGTFKYDFLQQSAYQNQQLNWLATTALTLPDKTWQTMIFTHCPLPGTFEVAAGQIKLSQLNSDVLISVLNAFQNGTTFKVDDTARELPVSLNCDFTAQGKGTIIGLISGHIHADGQMIYEGINCIETAGSLCYSGDASRVKNTETEDCWDIFSVDTAARKIHAYRFGFGADRDFTY